MVDEAFIAVLERMRDNHVKLRKDLDFVIASGAKAKNLSNWAAKDPDYFDHRLVQEDDAIAMLERAIARLRGE